MEYNKDQIQHHILNIFTIISCLISEKADNPDTCYEVKKLLGRAACYVEHEGILLGQTPSLFLQEVSLAELLETIKEVHSEDVESSTWSFSPIIHDVILQLDRYYIGVACRYLLEGLAEVTADLQIILDTDELILTIKHNLEKPFLADLQKEWFQKVDSGNNVTLWVALKIFESMGIDLISESHVVSIRFPKP